MKIAIMQPYIFPYIGYFQLISAVDTFIIYDDVSFINRGWINRNRILLNHAPYTFTIPLTGASQNKYIKDIEVNKEEKWKNKMIKQMTHAYKKAPFFEEVFPMVEKIICSQYSDIAKMSTESIKIVLDYLDIKTKIIESSTTYNNQELKGQYRIKDICIKENAKTYINPIGGMEIYDRNLFRNFDIELFFIKTAPIEYEQFKKEHVPYLSIIDVLMFNPKEKIISLLSKYDFV